MLPLSGVRVLDLSRLLAGPFCTTILGDLGADVIKVEALPRGDLYRHSAPDHHGESVAFLSINRNKRSVGVNYRTKEGLDLVRQMAESVDVIVENFKPGVMEDMGLSFEALANRSPRLIYASVSGFGRSGPYGELSGVDQIAQGMSGFMSITGQGETGPTRVGVPIGDLTAGMWAAIGVQAALFARQSSGHGQRVDTSLLHSLVGMLSIQGQRYLSLGEVPELAGNNHPVSSPYGLFHAADGVFNLFASISPMWDKLCRHLGLEWVLEDSRFTTSAARLLNRVELEALLNERFRRRRRDEWIAEMRELGIPAGPVYDLSEVFTDPQVTELKMVETVQHPTIGPLLQIASPVGLDCFKNGSVRRPPPLLGEHTHEVLEEFGFTPHQRTELTSAGAISPPVEIARQRRRK
ncbi:MAG: CaiB/BaiF CoA transferase family protein [Reyranellaceae bacterium]